MVWISTATESGYAVTRVPGDPPQGIAERYGATGARPSALSFAHDADRLLVQLSDGTLEGPFVASAVARWIRPTLQAGQQLSALVSLRVAITRTGRSQ